MIDTALGSHVIDHAHNCKNYNHLVYVMYSYQKTLAFSLKTFTSPGHTSY